MKFTIEPVNAKELAVYAEYDDERFCIGHTTAPLTADEREQLASLFESAYGLGREDA